MGGPSKKYVGVQGERLGRFLCVRTMWKTPKLAPKYSRDETKL